MLNCRGEIARRNVRHPSRIRIAIAGGLFLAFAVVAAAPALAASLKGLMREMGQTIKQTKPLLTGSFELAQAEAVLTDFARQADESAALYAMRGDVKADDMRARFVQLKNTADSARGTLKDKASFQHALLAVLQDCRSCHSAYR